MGFVYYHVAPRYTPGSPAQVPREIAERVAAEEKRAIEYHLSGAYGVEAQGFAIVTGLAGIVEQRQEIRNAWRVRDLCTDEIFVRPFPALRRRK